MEALIINLQNIVLLLFVQYSNEIINYMKLFKQLAVFCYNCFATNLSWWLATAFTFRRGGPRISFRDVAHTVVTYIFTQTLRFIIIRRDRITSKIHFFGEVRRAFAYRGNVEQLTVLYIKKRICFYSNQLRKNNNLLLGANIDNFTYLNTE